jgi:hypothetical protein
MVALLLALLALGASDAGAETRLVAVLPLDIARAHLPADQRGSLEESVRSAAGDALTSRGYTVLTADTILGVLADRGVDIDKAWDAPSALEAAKHLGASLFIAGTMHREEGGFVAFVHAYRSPEGKLLASAQIEGHSVRELRHAFSKAAPAFFSRALGEPVLQAEPPSAPPPRPPPPPEIHRATVARGHPATLVAGPKPHHETPHKLRGSELVLVGPLALRRQYLRADQHQALQAGMDALVRGLQVGCMSAGVDLLLGDLRKLAPGTPDEQFLREPMSTARSTRANAVVQGDILTDTKDRLEMHLLLYDLASGALLAKKTVYADAASDLIDGAPTSGQELCTSALP